MRTALTIAGSDSSGGAGIQADLKVFAELGVYGLSVVTAVTAQNSQGVRKINKVPPRVVAAQIDAVVRDIGADACKIGMLFSEQNVSIAAERIERRDIPNVVLDPVIFAKDGSRLLLARAVERMRRDLIPCCLMVAPNLAEAEELAKLPVKDIESAKHAAIKISSLGARYVLIKGGHFDADPIDLLFDGERFAEFAGARIEGKSLHGTGCILTAAIAARLAHGDEARQAVAFAKGFVASAIEKSVKLGKGKLWYYAGGGR
ncbi:MAG: bifunctional hydroxymethylpyrimidine kinase/phosphomethylpyrimidine kinase [Armatimonadetes bacterium]|nr:bifunctional hydroxymethylpyrimidine kinase/phosphomethylpyrimidine kinase [Armatimonadota bacterium]